MIARPPQVRSASRQASLAVSIRALLRDWERWSAELLESHVSFPVLSYFRSQHDNQSWVAALTTILDVCAFVMVHIDDGARPAARLTFAMARHAVVDMCAVFRLKPTPSPANRLPPEEEQRLESFLAAGGVPLETADGASAKLPEWIPCAEVKDQWHTLG